jgi:hypothetical protein
MPTTDNIPLMTGSLTVSPSGSYQTYPGNPQMMPIGTIPNLGMVDPVLVPLPMCDCGFAEIKPGEDSCLNCLGETEPGWEWEDFTIYPVSAAINGNLILNSSITVSNNTITFGPGIVLNSGDSLQVSYGYKDSIRYEWSNNSSAGQTMMIRAVSINSS